MRILSDLGKYLLLMREVFVKPDKVRLFFRQIMLEFVNLGVDSLGISLIISVFVVLIGAWFHFFLCRCRSCHPDGLQHRQPAHPAHHGRIHHKAIDHSRIFTHYHQPDPCR